MENKRKIMRWNTVSEHRQFIMALACIWIILAHAVQDGIIRNIGWGYIVGRGALGVDMFLFLSGMGWYYSLCKNGYAYIVFWQNRYRALLTKYLPIAIAYMAIKCMTAHSSFTECLGELTTISYWTQHKGVWYIALLIPLYLVFPVWRNWIEHEKARRPIKVILSIVILCIATSVLPKKILICDNIANAFCKVPSLMIGYYFGKKAYEKRAIRWFEVIILICIPVLGKITGASQVLRYTWISVGACLTLIATIVGKIFLEIAPRLYKEFSKLGIITLEMYICNIYIRDWCILNGYFSWIHINSTQQRMSYFCIVIIGGFIISLLYYLLIKRVRLYCITQ